MPLIETKGAASAQGFGLTLQQAAPVYIEDVFSTWLYTGTASTQTITNGIDLSTKGGLVWTKARGSAFSHGLVDTARGTTNTLVSNLTDASDVYNTVTAFNTNGFTVGTSAIANGTGTTTMVSWTFRKQPKFFDVVTYTGNGSTQAISHSLGSVPGCIIIKSTSSYTNWVVYHRSLGEDYFLQLNLTDSRQYSTTVFNITAPTSTNFTVGSNSLVNTNGESYVAYIFAHNAGGFGLTGTDNVITCGTFTTDGSGNATVNLGYEPQWLLVKQSSTTSDWIMVDNMRGWSVGGTDAVLYANRTNAENVITSPDYFSPTATGFQWNNGWGSGNHTSIYIAIRRGPMKTPTTGTSVFAPVSQNGGGTVTTNFPSDLSITKDRNVSSTVGDNFAWTRLIGSTTASSAAINLKTNSTVAESAGSFSAAAMNVSNTAVVDNFFANTYPVVYWNFRRAPGFFDVVCYTGTGSARTVDHNLGVVPELMIVKGRSFTSSWHIYDATNGATNYMRFNNDPSTALSTIWNNTAPTSTQFTVGTSVGTNSSGQTYVAYLFSTVAGVSKVGSYTGTGALQTVNCGFTGGARFVLIKRTDAGGDWWVYDSARGISSGNDPYLFWNTTDAEVTGTNYVDTTSVGFQVTAAAPAGLNANGGTFIFLAIA